MSKQFNFRCPDDLYAAIEAEASAKGIEKTAVVLDAIRAQLGIPLTSREADAGLSIRLDQVEAQLAAVIAQLAELLSPAPQPSPVKPSQVPGQLSLLATGDDQADDQQTKTNKPQEPTGEWLHHRQAFELLGGNLSDPESAVPSLDGSKAYKVATFRLKAKSLEAFGFERHPDNGALVRILPALAQRLATKRNGES